MFSEAEVAAASRITFEKSAHDNQIVLLAAAVLREAEGQRSAEKELDELVSAHQASVSRDEQMLKEARKR